MAGGRFFSDADAAKYLAPGGEWWTQARNQAMVPVPSSDWETQLPDDAPFNSMAPEQIAQSLGLQRVDGGWYEPEFEEGSLLGDLIAGPGFIASVAFGAQGIESLLTGGLDKVWSSITNAFSGEGGISKFVSDLFSTAPSETITKIGAQIPGEFGLAEGAASAAETLGGVSTSPQKFLVADAGTTMTDVGPGLVEQAMGPDWNAVASGWEGAAADSAAQNAAMATATGAAPAAGGIINSKLATQLGLGALQGAGQSMLLDRKIKADRAAQQQALEDKIALEQWKRAFTQGGAIGTSRIPIAPAAGGGTLRRPDGTPVYARPGILAGAM
jgi:hypothetical protein